MTDEITKDRSDHLTRFNSETGRAASLKRWNGYREAAEQGIIRKAREMFGDEITDMRDAWAKVAEAQYEQAVKNGTTPPAKFIGQVIDALPRGGNDAPQQDNRQVHIYLHKTTGLVETLTTLADKFRLEGDEKTARYIEAQINYESEFPQQVEYPITLNSPTREQI